MHHGLAASQGCQPFCFGFFREQILSGSGFSDQKFPAPSMVDADGWLIPES
jgi:hypothetical protein